MRILGTGESKWLRTPVPLSQTKSRCVLFCDGKVSLFNGMAYFLPTVICNPGIAWDGVPWPIGGNVNLGDAAVDPANRNIVRHRDRVNRPHVDGHVAPITGSWEWSVRQLEW